MSLKILLADDQPNEVAEARKVLKDMAHEVVAASTYEEAMKHARDGTFDIAVVDLGWYCDPLPTSEVGEEDKGAMGWRILGQIKSTNPDTVRILYSARTDEPKITQTATEEDIYCIQKRYTPEGRLLLGDVIKVVAHRIGIENELKDELAVKERTLQEAHAQIETLEATLANIENAKSELAEQNTASELEQLRTELEDAQIKNREYEKQNSEAETEKTRFNRILLAVVGVPLIAFVLFIATWFLTQQLVIAILAFVGGSFLLLALLSATKAITFSELEYLGNLLKSLFPNS